MLYQPTKQDVMDLISTPLNWSIDGEYPMPICPNCGGYNVQERHCEDYDPTTGPHNESVLWCTDCNGVAE